MSAEKRANLISKGFDWMRGSNLHNVSWPIVWNVFWGERIIERHLLIRIAHILLIKAPPKTSDSIIHKVGIDRNGYTPSDGHVPIDYGWKDEWEAAWKVAPTGVRAELADRAKTWLGAFDLKQGGWSSVWKHLWDATESKDRDRTCLIDLAYRWLGLDVSSHPRWSTIWMAVWNEVGTDPIANNESLAALGKNWLSTSVGTN